MCETSTYFLNFVLYIPPTDDESASGKSCADSTGSGSTANWCSKQSVELERRREKNEKINMKGKRAMFVYNVRAKHGGESMFEKWGFQTKTQL